MTPLSQRNSHMYLGLIPHLPYQESMILKGLITDSRINIRKPHVHAQTFALCILVLWEQYIVIGVHINDTYIPIDILWI